MTFTEKVYEAVKGIPPGETRTYKEIAELAGSKNAYRTVGSLMKKNYNPEIPCHRVVKSDGSMGDYNRGGAKKKKSIIDKEKRDKFKSFMAKCISGDAKASDIHDYIELWHGSDGTLPIYKYLGMTKKEYILFVEKEDNLIGIIEARKTANV